MKGKLLGGIRSRKGAKVLFYFHQNLAASFIVSKDAKR